MRILVLDTYYSRFWTSFYAQNPSLAGDSYDHQWRALMDQCFGTADFYSMNLRQLGHEATEVVTNCEPLQRQWARENGVTINEAQTWRMMRRKGVIPWPVRVPASDWFYVVLAAQIKQFRPDVLYVQDPNSLAAVFLREIRSYVGIIACQIACPVVSGTEFSEYNLILSSLPNFVERFRRQGLESEYLRLAFEPKVLDRLSEDTRYEAVFVGSISPSHAGRIQFLEQISASTALEVWGHGIEQLRHDSPLRQKYHGEAWGLEMYRVLHHAAITLNYHIDLAERYANNMRLFEATGVGTLLITDGKENLSQMFESGQEVVVYNSPEECLELVRYYLEHSEERTAIARRGQQRTLRDHTYSQRMQELVALLEASLSGSGRARIAVPAMT